MAGGSDFLEVPVDSGEQIPAAKSPRCTEARPADVPVVLLPAHGELEAGPVAPGHLGPRHRLPGSLPAYHLALARLETVRLQLNGLVTVLAQVLEHCFKNRKQK